MEEDKGVDKIVLDPETSYVMKVEKLPKKLSLSKEEFEEVWKSHPDEHGLFMIHGKTIEIPRWQKIYMKDYKFSGVNHVAASKEELPKPVLKLLNWVVHMESTVNGVLINWYQDGNHYIGYHSDATKGLKSTKIWSFSFGQERKFYLKSKSTDIVTELSMPDNSLIIMCGTTQSTHKHSVPKISGKKGENMGRRINITFRSFE